MLWAQCHAKLQDLERLSPRDDSSISVNSTITPIFVLVKADKSSWIELVLDVHPVITFKCYYNLSVGSWHILLTNSVNANSHAQVLCSLV